MLCSFTFLWLMPCCLTCSNQYLKVNLNEHLQVMTKYIFLTTYPIVFNCTAIISVTTRDKKPYRSTKSNITLFISAIIDSCMSYLSINTLARAESLSSPRQSRSSLHLENACRYLSGFYSSVCHTVRDSACIRIWTLSFCWHFNTRQRVIVIHNSYNHTVYGNNAITTTSAFDHDIPVWWVIFFILFFFILCQTSLLFIVIRKKNSIKLL